MLRYHFYDKKVKEHDRYSELLITEAGQLEREEREICSEIFERAYRQIDESVQPYLNPKKCAMFRRLSLRAVELACFLSANISIDVGKNGEGTLCLESDMFLLTSRDDKEFSHTIARLFTTADHILYSILDNELPKIEFTFLLYDEKTV